MTNLDIHQTFNALSDVVVNRPPPLREFDQIYMKISDMLLQAELLSRWVEGKSVVCIGDGDALGLTLVHLEAKRVLKRGPEHVHVLDFDERIVNSINTFAITNQLQGKISADLYNVADPLPVAHIAKFEAFYTNPPFGASNGGRSVEAFLKRGDEALAAGGTACVVVADDPARAWTKEVIRGAQRYLLDNGFVFSELLPQFHKYHLDDDPELTSCTMIAVRDGEEGVKSQSKALPKEYLKSFYGKCSSLKVRYVRDDLKWWRIAIFRLPLRRLGLGGKVGDSAAAGIYFSCV